MVNLAGISPPALPLHVPPGHMVQQIVEQGILRHLILSPEPPPTSRLLAGNAYAATATNSATTLMAPLKDSSRRNWAISSKEFDVSNNNHILQPLCNTFNEIDQSHSGASINEEEDWEKYIDLLSKVKPPQILRVGAREADIAYREIDHSETFRVNSTKLNDWQELDISEGSHMSNISASSTCGSYTQLDQYEFTYDIVLFESIGRIVSSYRCEPDCGNRVRLCRLKPNTDYYIQLRASLEELGLQGKPSKAIRFHTLSTVPECLYPPRFISSTSTSITISWKSAIDNGSKIISYRVQIAKEMSSNNLNGNYDDSIDYETVFDALTEQATITNLQPSTKYRLRIIAVNNEGASRPSAHIIVLTPKATTATITTAISKPDMPKVVMLTSNSITLSWDVLSHHLYTLEMCESTRNGKFSTFYEKTQQSSAVINDLISNRQYSFRLLAFKEDLGYSEPSDLLIVRTLPSNIFVPNRPYIVVNDGSNLEIGWKSNQLIEKDVFYVVEGSNGAGEIDDEWSIIYKGTSNSLMIKNYNLCAFRVATCKNNLQSAWSGILRVKKDVKKIDQIIVGLCSPPTLTEISKGRLRVEWCPPERGGEALASSSVLFYQLNRTNIYPTSMIYQGEATMYDITNCVPGEEVEVQVRAVIKSSNGATVGGEWSRTAIGRISLQPPSPPVGVYVDEQFILNWKSPATLGSPIDKYIVERIRMKSSSNNDEENGQSLSNSDVEDEWTVRNVDGNSCSLDVHDGRPGCKYQLSISAISASGTSLPSDCVYVSIPPTVPSPPSSFQVFPHGCCQLKAMWMASCHNGCKLLEYILHVEDEVTQDLIQELKFSADSLENECIIENLESDHSYKLSICATNSIGSGKWSSVVMKTLAPPPPAPNLICSEVGSNYLKLKWKPVESVSISPNLYYYLEKENDSGKFSPIYEGDNRYAKVRNLSESTKYRFRIRCSSRASGAGPWSKPFEFSTEQLPPPTIRAAPTVTEIKSGTFQVEWSPLRLPLTNGKESLFYRLQLASRTSSEKSAIIWKTIYEGVSTCYSFSSCEAVQLRVQCVRLRNGTESVSAPSAIQFVKPSLVLSSNYKDINDTLTPNIDITKMQWIQYHIFSDKNYAFIILIFFIALAFIVALAIDAFLFTRQ